MSKISAVLFDKNGNPSATMRAPVATGDTVNQKIVASHGVVYIAITPRGVPTGQSLSADTVTWNAKSDEIVATGHVLYQDRAKGVTMNAPRAVSDTHLRNVRLENTDMVLNMSGSGRR
jgi:lipopolysaccharide assembly outer membrane protein LptD (OstA)